MNCLIIIDVQEGFMSTISTRTLPSKIANLVSTEHFDFVIATRFENESGSQFERHGWHGMMDADERRVLPLIASVSCRIFVKKGYSALTDEVMTFIASYHVDSVFLVGVETDGCVLATAIDCLDHGIDCHVLSDYCATNGNEEDENAGYRVMERMLIDVI